MNSNKKSILFVLVLCILLPKISFSHRTKKDNTYYSYVGLSLGIGGANINLFNAEGTNIANLGNEFTTGSIIAGFQINAGIEFRFKNNFYYAIEILGSAMFNNTVLSSAISGTSSEIFWQEQLPNDPYNLSTNAFQGIHIINKVGITAYGKFAFYGLFGPGVMFVGNYIQDSPAGADPTNATFNMNHFSLLYGIGANYYFHENFGLLFQFISAIPMNFAAPINTANAASFTFGSFVINLGLSVRF